MATPADDARALQELVDATRLFVRRHEEALASGAPPRVLEAVEGLHRGVAETLATEAAALHNRLLAQGRTPPRTPGDFGASFERLRSGDAHEREAWAYTALAKRVSETEGALLHLRLTLSRRSADGPAIGGWARRVAHETTTVARTLAALQRALHEWAVAYAAATGGAFDAPAPATPRDALRAAREALIAGIPEAAGPALRHALHAGLAAPLGLPHDTPLPHLHEAWLARGAPAPATEGDLRAADEALHTGLEDPVLAWRLLDYVEMTLQRASMSRGAPTGAPPAADAPRA